MAAVKIRDLIVRYGDRSVVSGLSLDVAEATVTALVGPNGAGKTSTVEACVGLRPFAGGQITLLGVHLPAAPREQASLSARVGVMLQDGGLYATARPLEMVSHIARLHPRSDDPASLLAAVGIDPSTRTPLRRMSGGEQRRVAAAAALAGHPQLVFLDEPTTGLDAAGRRAFHDLLIERVRDGLTVVLTTHLMDDVERLADHVAVMAAGRVVASGSVHDLVGDDDTVCFRGPLHMPVDDLAAALPAGTAIEECPAGRFTVRGQLDPLALSTIAAWCAQHAVPTRDIALGRRTLEDVVIDLTAQER